MARHLATGEAGEEIAARYLQKLGLRILEQRVRLGKLEIDIVARQGSEWVFVEVKARRAGRFGSAAEAFSGGRKLSRLRRAVEEYVRRNGLEKERIRYDFVAVDFAADGVPTVSHFPGYEM